MEISRDRNESLRNGRRSVTATPKKELSDLEQQKSAFTINELLQVHPGGRTRLYDEINSGRLVARKIGRQTVILASDYQEYLQSLPKIAPKREAGA